VGFHVFISLILCKNKLSSKFIQKPFQMSCYGTMQCEKLCLQKLHYHAIGTLKQLIYNYTTTISWKYEGLQNKMPS